MGIATRYRALLAAFMIFCGLCLIGKANAEGTVYVGGLDVVKRMNCTDATTRTDGTPLDVSEIDRVEMYVSQTDQDLNPPHTVIMAGGCQPINFDLTQLTDGQWYQYGLTVDTEGRRNGLSATVPFVYSVKAPPGPPTGIE